MVAGYCSDGVCVCVCVLVMIEFQPHVCLPLATGEGQFGRVFKAIAEGICPHDSNRNVVAVKTLKGKAIGRLHLCLPFVSVSLYVSGFEEKG